MDMLTVRPPRALLKNLATGEEMPFLFNPQTLTEALEAKYNRIVSPGNSHERLQYTNTGNTTIPLELFMSQLAQDVIQGRADSRPRVPTERKPFLQALAYPASNRDYSYQGPPRVLFIWPHMFRMVGRITRLEFMHREFANRTLATTVMVAQLTFEEDLDFRLLMEDVQRIGGIHASPMGGGEGA
jgi:hypothetical protein